MPHTRTNIRRPAARPITTTRARERLVRWRSAGGLVDFVTWPGTPKALVELERRRQGKPPSIRILSNQQTAAILEAAGWSSSPRDPRATELLERVCLAMGRAVLVDKQIDRAPSAAHWRDETERVLRALEQAAVALSDAPLPVRRLARAEWHAANECVEALIGRLECIRRTIEQQPSQHRPTSSAARGAVVELAGIWRDWRCVGRHPLSRREQRRQARDFVSTCLDVLNVDLSFRMTCALVRRVIG